MHDQEGAYSDQNCINYCAHPGYLLNYTKIISGFTLGGLLLATFIYRYMMRIVFIVLLYVSSNINAAQFYGDNLNM